MVLFLETGKLLFTFTFTFTFTFPSVCSFLHANLIQLEIGVSYVHYYNFKRII
jgi:hypothetical protein